jgi:hypothetical protein
MNFFLIRNVKTNEFAGDGYRNWTSKTPRTFTRQSDLTTHLNYQVESRVDFRHTQYYAYRDVNIEDVEIIIYKFNKDDQTFSSLPDRISLKDYRNKRFGRMYAGLFKERIHYGN